MADTLVVYWSGTGNTEIMAQKIKEGIEAQGDSVDLRTVDEVQASEVADFEKIMFGCPSMGAETLEEDEFEPFFAEIEGMLSGKKVALFGSFDWGNGEWMDEWQERVTEAGASLYKEGLKVNLTPDDDGEQECIEFGQGFSKF